jgi:CBS domain-containing protein
VFQIPKKEAAMNAADIMTSDVLTLSAETSVLDAARTMLRHRVSGLPVIDWNGKLVGVLTEGDLLRRAETGTERRRAHWLELLMGPGRAAADYVHSHGRKVSEVMTDQVISVAPDTTLEQAVAAMERHKIKRLPVVANGKLVGIVSRHDFLRALTDKVDQDATTPTSDDDIRARIEAELKRQPWAPRAAMKISVNKGMVELSGTITDERERTALRVLCENIGGVKSVVDHLAWVDPLSGMAILPPDEKGR